MCNMNIYIWNEVRQLVYFFHWGLSDWHCLRFAALWLCLSAGAAEVIFWFAVLVPLSPHWPQDIVTILWPHPPTLSHDSWPGCCCSLLNQLSWAVPPSTLSLITLIQSFLSTWFEEHNLNDKNLYLNECVFVLCFFLDGLHFCLITLCVTVLTSTLLISFHGKTEQFTQAVLCSLMALQPNTRHAQNFSCMPKP